MNTAWKVEEPINIWHVSWICLHNWCGNLNWIIIASLWIFRPLSLIIFLTLCIPLSSVILSRPNMAPSLKHMRCTGAHTCTHTHTHTQMGADRQSMWSQGVTDTWHWWTHWVAYRFACLCAVIDSCTSFLTFSRTHARTPSELRLSQASCCSPVSCRDDILCVWCWCQTHYQMIVCVLRKKRDVFN